jgi:hypothetical protein
MRKLKIAGILSAALVLSTVAGGPARSQQSPPIASEPVPAADIDPNSFGFSVSDFAASLGVKLRGLLGSRSAVDQVRDIVDPAALEYNYYRPVLGTLSAWTAGSSFSGLVRVNQPLKAGFVNFFILNHNHLAAKAPTLACNCSYVPESWSIVCDGLFLANAQRLLESKPAPNTSPPTADKNDDAKKKNDDDKDTADLDLQIQGMFRSFLFEWMIAHELGHLLHNHTAKDLARSWNYSNGIPIGLAAEKEADEFYISRMQHNQQRQFGAWIGLSNVITRLYGQAVRAQHRPEELQAQITKNGPRFIFETELGIDVRYVADKHPPLLVRALNLANLVIARYPQMYDSTGYFDRVRDRINPIQSTVPDSPELCLTNNTTTDEDSSEEQVLAKHLDILLTQTAPSEWTRATIDKLRKRVSERKEPAALTLSSLATDLSEALAEPDAAKARSRIEAVEAAGEGISEPYRATLRLLSLATRARAGLLPEAMSTADAVKNGEARLNELIRAGGLDLSKSSEKMDALRLLLQIGLARGKTRDAKIEAVLNSIVGDLLQLQDIADIDKQMLLQILEADYSTTSQENGAPDNTVERANSAMRVAALADQNGWSLIEVNYLASQLVLLERIKPKPLENLMAGYFGLGRQLQFAGYAEAAPAMFQKAIDNADAALASNERSAADKKEIAGQRLRFLNDLGWSFLILRKFSDALVPLNIAREGRVAEYAGRAHCDKSHPLDIELATVNQNLADVSLALGKFSVAAGYARQARQCRIELDIKNKIIESTKTEGYALIYSGKQSEGMVLVKEYSAAIRQFLDDDVLPKGDPFISGAIVDGQFVPLEQFVQFPDKNRPVKILPVEPAPEIPKEKQ